MILSWSLRIIRKIFRYIVDLYNWLAVKLSLILNNVKHKSIRCNGRPYIAVSPKGSCVIGENFSMNNGVRHNPIGFPQPCQIVVTANAKLNIGNNVGISQASIICHKAISIGDYVKIGGGVKIYDTNFHSLDPIVRRDPVKDMQEKKCSPVIIEHDVFIGAGSIILSGVTIGASSIVAAGSVVVKNIPPNEIWGGNPDKFIRKI